MVVGAQNLKLGHNNRILHRFSHQSAKFLPPESVEEDQHALWAYLADVDFFLNCRELLLFCKERSTTAAATFSHWCTHCGPHKHKVATPMHINLLSRGLSAWQKFQRQNWDTTAMFSLGLRQFWYEMPAGVLQLRRTRSRMTLKSCSAPLSDSFDYSQTDLWVMGIAVTYEQWKVAQRDESNGIYKKN